MVRQGFKKTASAIVLLLFWACSDAPSQTTWEGAEQVDLVDELAAAGPLLRLGTFYRTQRPLRLRTEPSASAEARVLMPQNAKVSVLRGPFQEAWYEVAFQGQRGFAHGRYLMSGRARPLALLPTEEKVVALTFDAGADLGHMALILDTLAAEGVKATFGLTGKWVEKNPEWVKRMVNEGHLLLNLGHTYRSMTGFSDGLPAQSYEERADALWKTQSGVYQLTGASIRPYFRPPYGDFDESVLADVSSRGYDYGVLWSVDSWGWKGLSAEQIVQRSLAALNPGAVYLFQVGAASQDGPALATLLREMRAQGYAFARISDFAPSEDVALPPPPVKKVFTYEQGAITRGSVAEKKLSLVFTGGYHAESAPTILDALAARQIHASFFLTGAFLRLYPALVDRMVREGHYIGAHSQDHLLYASWDNRAQTLVSKDTFNDDLNRNLAGLAAHGPTVASMRYWIPPYEWYNAEISQWSEERGMTLFNFTAGSGSEWDWRGDSHPRFVSSQAIVEHILSYEAQQTEGLRGFLMILHLGSGPDRTDKFHPYFPGLLDALQERGYTFQRVDTLLGP